MLGNSLLAPAPSIIRRQQKNWSKITETLYGMMNGSIVVPMTNRQLPYAYQTKQWFPSPYRRVGIFKFGRPTLGYFIQFFTGHGWFRRHCFKIDKDSSLCRFCKSALEDPEHLWSSCRTFDGVRHAIIQDYKQDDSSVSFSKPFKWSVTQLIRFFRDPKMAELLTGPGSQQNPL